MAGNKTTVSRKRISDTIKNQLSKIYGKKCGYCGCKLSQGNNFTIDHKIPLSRGGTNLISNLLPCCQSCNSLKGMRDVEQFRLFIFFEVFNACYTDSKFRVAVRCGAIVQNKGGLFHFERVDKKLKMKGKLKEFDELYIYTAEIEKN